MNSTVTVTPVLAAGHSGHTWACLLLGAHSQTINFDLMAGFRNRRYGYPLDGWRYCLQKYMGR